MDITSYLLGKKAGGGTPAVLQDKEVEITENGETTIRPDSGYNGLSSVEVTTNVPQPSGKITITQNGTNIDVSSYANADVNVPTGITPTGTINITTNGTHDVTNYASASVNVPSQKYAPKWMKFGSDYNTNSFRGNDLSYEVDNLDTSNITDMKYMFGNCDGLTSLDLRNFNTSNVTTMYSMFIGCYNLETLNISGWDVSKVTQIRNMFNGCQKLTSINVPDFNISKLNSSDGMSNVFSGMKLLTSLDLSNLYVDKNINISNMFNNDIALMFIDMRNFDFTKITTTSYYNNLFGSTASNGVPDNCEIIVKDATQKQWINTNFSRLTNVKTVAEIEA